MKQGGLYQNKVNSSLASIFKYKMGYSKEQRWILNSQTGLPKPQGTQNHNSILEAKL